MPRWSRSEAGYLWEIPLLVLFAALVVAVVTPMLPGRWRLIPVGILGVAVVIFLVYNFVIPGWLPKKRK